MNIVILGPAYPWRGGIAHFSTLLYRCLQNKHQVEVVTFKRQYPKILFPGKTQIEEKTGDARIQIPTLQLVDSLNPFNWIRVGLLLRRKRCDVIVYQFWQPLFGLCFGIINAIASFRTKTKVVAVCHNVIPHEQHVGESLCTRFAFRFTDGFIPLSAQVERDLLKVVKKPQYRQVTLPVYELFGEAISKLAAREKLGITAKQVILFFGYIRKYKGLDVLLRAMPLVRKSMPIHLLVVGEFYEDEQHYRADVQQAGLEECVQFVSGYVPGDRVPEYFSAADCVVLPYRSATQSAIVQIAYHFDKPVIVTDVGGLSETAKDGVSGFVVPPESPELLAEAVLNFYRENREAEFIKGVQQEKKKYSSDHLVEAIEQLTEER
jgi:glycosyltransferase involved in cell wall biosynthesis